jgi:hypothetical protein
MPAPLQFHGEGQGRLHISTGTAALRWHGDQVWVEACGGEARAVNAHRDVGTRGREVVQQVASVAINLGAAVGQQQCQQYMWDVLNRETACLKIWARGFGFASMCVHCSSHTTKQTFKGRVWSCRSPKWSSEAVSIGSHSAGPTIAATKAMHGRQWIQARRRNCQRANRGHTTQSEVQSSTLDGNAVGRLSE